MKTWLLIGAMLLQNSVIAQETGVFVPALQFVQAYGLPNAASPENDRLVKSTLAKALANDKALAINEVQDLIAPQIFSKLAGDDELLQSEEINRALQTSTPQSQMRLLSPLREHAAYLATTYDLLSESQLESSRKLGEWLADHYDSSKPLNVIVVCTGNSRRSILGACMGNLSANYYGLERVRFHSGGTAPSAFNRRTIASLQQIGFEITPTGDEAERGEPRTANPKYTVRWGQGLESLEFSKKYSDPSNPASGFAALMVCSEADSECPSVPGAALRLPMPFLDPKSYDDSKYEAAKYAERRDDIGRVLMAAMAIAKGKLVDKP